MAAPLAAKLTGVEKNDAKSWLPGSAESTRCTDASSAARRRIHSSAAVPVPLPSGGSISFATRWSDGARRFAAPKTSTMAAGFLRARSLEGSMLHTTATASRGRPKRSRSGRTGFSGRISGCGA